MTDDWKPSGSKPGDDDVLVYLIADQEADHRIDLGGDAWLLVRDRDGWISFAVFEFECGPTTQASTGEIVAPVQHAILFHGSGAGGELRECRHIWWGEEEGYTFYLNFRVVEAALRELRRWFDGD